MNWFGILDETAGDAFGASEHFRAEYVLAGLMVVLGVFALSHDPKIGALILASQLALFGYLAVRSKVRRRRRDPGEIEGLAKRAGLRHAAPGEFDLYSLPFPVFRNGEWQGFDSVFVADWSGPPGHTERSVRAGNLWVFDSWYGFEVHGHDVEEYFTCAALELRGVDCPKLSITRENPWSRGSGHLGWRDIEVESEDFNRRFDVSGEDEQFAFALLSPGMIQWLQTTPPEFEFAVEGRWLLCRSKWLPTPRWWDLLRMVRDFRGRIPATIERLYPDAPARRHAR